MTNATADQLPVWEFEAREFWTGTPGLLVGLLLVTPIVVAGPDPSGSLVASFVVAPFVVGPIAAPWIVGSWLIVGVPLGWTIRTALRRFPSLSLNLVAYAAAGALTALLAFLAYIQAGGVPFVDNVVAPPTDYILDALFRHWALVGPVLVESALLTSAAWLVTTWRSRSDVRSARAHRRRDA